MSAQNITEEGNVFSYILKEPKQWWSGQPSRNGKYSFKIPVSPKSDWRHELGSPTAQVNALAISLFLRISSQLT